MSERGFAVSSYARTVIYIIITNFHEPLVSIPRRAATQRLPCRSCILNVIVARGGHQIGRPASTDQGRRHRHRRYHRQGSPRCIRHGRAPAPGHLRSATLQLQQTTGPVRRLVTVDPQGFRFVKNPLLPTFDTTLGPRSQTLEQIGQTGAMVLRMRMPHGADADPCRLQRRTRDEGRTVKTFTEMN